MEFLFVLVILLVVVYVVTAPVRRRAPEGAAGGADAQLVAERADAELLELEAAREAKYREIRDAELDHQTGKLSDEDFRAVDQAMRGEAIEILRRLDQARARGHGGSAT